MFIIKNYKFVWETTVTLSCPIGMHIFYLNYLKTRQLIADLNFAQVQIRFDASSSSVVCRNDQHLTSVNWQKLFLASKKRKKKTLFLSGGGWHTHSIQPNKNKSQSYSKKAFWRNLTTSTEGWQTCTYLGDAHDLNAMKLS